MKMLKKFFSVASKVDKGKSKSKPEEKIAKRVKLRPEKIAEIDGKEKKNIHCLVITLPIQTQAICITN